MRTNVNGVLDGLPIFLLVELDLGREIEIMRRGINRVHAEDQKRSDLA